VTVCDRTTFAADPSEVTAPYEPLLHCSGMDRELASRIELLEAAAAKGEKALARQRRLIEELRDVGHGIADAEEALQRFEASHRGLLEKLAGLRIDCTALP